jgi:hypothetical protein
MNLIISRNSVLAIISTTLEVDEGKENEDLSRQRSCGVLCWSGMNETVRCVI